jgi:hypothetical protein
LRRYGDGDHRTHLYLAIGAERVPPKFGYAGRVEDELADMALDLIGRQLFTFEAHSVERDVDHYSSAAMFSASSSLFLVLKSARSRGLDSSTVRHSAVGFELFT